jgi:hypothetical protein
MTVGQVRKLAHIDCLCHQERDEIIGWIVAQLDDFTDDTPVVVSGVIDVGFEDEEVSEPEVTFPDGDLE